GWKSLQWSRQAAATRSPAAVAHRPACSRPRSAPASQCTKWSCPLATIRLRLTLATYVQDQVRFHRRVPLPIRKSTLSAFFPIAAVPYWRPKTAFRNGHAGNALFFPLRHADRTEQIALAHYFPGA